jgi:hypothetical protein
MTGTLALPKKLIVLGVVLPLAALVGYLLADGDFESLAIVGVLAGFMAIPLFLRWHHLILVASWNLSMTLFFLPGSPPAWMLAAMIGSGLVLLAKIMDRNKVLLHAPSVTWTLGAIVFFVLFTMAMTGTLGIRSLGGSSYGGKKYFYILLAVIAYFGLSTIRIPPDKFRLYIAVFFIAGLSPVLGNIIYKLGPGLWFLFALFPPESVLLQASEDFAMDGFGTKLGRMQGLAVGSTAFLGYLLARYGIRGMLDTRRPWRVLLLAATFGAGLFGGFRSVLALNGALILLQFYLEGLHRTRLFPMLLIGSVAAVVCIFPFARQLPLSVQRTLSFLPLDVSPAARQDAKGSTDWRFRMWEAAWPDVTRYFWVGKGYTASASQYFLTQEATRYGMAEDFETSLLAGDYHNGLLSILIPFGIFAVIAFLAFLWAGFRVLQHNFRNGTRELKIVNAFLLSSFIVRSIFFFAVFGGIHSDILTLAGLVGFSIALNNGVCRRPALAPAKPQVPQDARPC